MTVFRLGINTCFAVKRWPEPEEWAAIVRDDLGLDLVQHSLDLADVAASDDLLLSQAQAVRTLASIRALLSTRPSPVWQPTRRTCCSIRAPRCATTGRPGSPGRSPSPQWPGLRFRRPCGGIRGKRVARPARRTQRWNDLKQTLRGLAARARSAGCAASTSRASPPPVSRPPWTRSTICSPPATPSMFRYCFASMSATSAFPARRTRPRSVRMAGGYGSRLGAVQLQQSDAGLTTTGRSPRRTTRKGASTPIASSPRSRIRRDRDHAAVRGHPRVRARR